MCLRMDAANSIMFQKQASKSGRPLQNTYTQVIRMTTRFLWMTLGLIFLLDSGTLAGEWPRFRGPNGSGVSETKRLPDKLDAESNVAWKVAVGTGLSSPIVANGRVYITSYEGDERRLEAFDASSGKRQWVHSVTKVHDEVATPLGGHATPTPVIGNDQVTVFFPDFGLVACSTAGKELWKTQLGPFKTMHGLMFSSAIPCFRNPCRSR